MSEVECCCRSDQMRRSVEGIQGSEPTYARLTGLASDRSKPPPASSSFTGTVRLGWIIDSQRSEPSFGQNWLLHFSLTKQRSSSMGRVLSSHREEMP
jgi:hypothetical protein